ncbi:MAG: aminotransferase class I/II-fold pyridoxal phosphate-dependent enzyme, partial [Pirellulales bacterium]|nr:aminotransferase class I/II-fold pyridoxal phosphate-dependent enzyme [Pirellulales bacterium]
IVTDAVFSMDGHVAPLVRLCDLAERYDAMLIVDEAHGTGVLGKTGSGLCEELGIKDRVPIRIGTLSKAIGAQGGFVAGPRPVIDYLVNRCRPLIYSTALMPAAVEAALSALERIQHQPQLRTRVRRLASLFRSRFSISSGPVEQNVPIIALPVGENARALAISRRLAERGCYVPAIRPPTVPEGTARLRISLSAAHDDPMVEQLSTALQTALELV